MAVESDILDEIYNELTKIEKRTDDGTKFLTIIENNRWIVLKHKNFGDLVVRLLHDLFNSSNPLAQKFFTKIYLDDHQLTCGCKLSCEDTDTFLGSKSILCPKCSSGIKPWMS